MPVSVKRTQRAFSKLGYVGNFLNSDVRVGNVYQMDDKLFLPLGNISELVPSLDLGGMTSTGTKNSLKFDSESDVKVSFGANATLELGKGEVLLEFKRANTAFVSLASATIQSLKLEPLRERISELWAAKKYKRDGRHVLVSEVVRAESGTLIFTQEKNNKVVLKHSANEAVSSVTKLGSGNFEFVTNSKGTLEIIFTEPATPMFRALYPKKNGMFEILG